MNTPNPVPPLPPPNPLTPSNSVMVGLGVGTPIVIVLSWVLDQFFHISVPPEVAAAGGSIIAGGLAYFANGGKAIHTA